MFLIMRAIEQLMNYAIRTGKDWRRDNTKVETQDGVSTVYLYGNKIAEIGDNFIRLYDGGHQSKTTRSRLNAILSAHGLPGEWVYQRANSWFVVINGVSVPFFSGMRLN